MTYSVTLSGTTFTVDMTAVSFPVTLSQVGQQGATGPSWQGVWALSTDYTVNDVVSSGGSAYICILAHTSASTDEPGVGVNTATYWAILAAGGADGTDGIGFTGGSYDGGTGVVTFTSDDGLGFSTGDLRGADGVSFTWLGPWTTATDYAADDVVENDGSSYICILGHTSSASDEPGVGVNTATYWELVAQKGADGAGVGTVTSIDITGGTGVTSSGGPITSSGAITVALDSATQASLALADSAQQPPLEGAFVDGDKTKLDGIETLADVTDTANVTAAGALMDSEVTNLAAVKAFDPTDYATAAQGALADSAVQPGDDADTLGSGAATDGWVLTADGVGGAAWEAAAGEVTLDGAETLTNKTMDLSANTVTVDGTEAVGFRRLPAEVTSGKTLAVGDVGKMVRTSGAITVPNNTFSQGDALSIYNQSTSDVTITLSITNAYISGGTTDYSSVTLNGKGVVSLWFDSGTECVLMGDVS